MRVLENYSKKHNSDKSKIGLKIWFKKSSQPIKNQLSSLFSSVAFMHISTLKSIYRYILYRCPIQSYVILFGSKTY